MNDVLKVPKYHAIPFAVYLVLAIAHAYTVQPQAPEGELASSAVNLIRNGFMGCTIFADEGPYKELSSYTYWQPPLYFLALAAVFKVCGVGLLQTRLMSVAFGLLGLIAFYGLARHLFDKEPLWVLLATLLVATDLFFVAGAIGRQDIMAVAFFFCGLTVYLTKREESLERALFWANGFVCLSGLSHPNGILAFLVLAFLTLYLDGRRLTIKMLLLGATPYAIGALGWGGYILQNVEAFKAQMAASIQRHEYDFYVNGIKWKAVYHELVNRYLYSYGLNPLRTSQLVLLKLPIFLVYMGSFLCGFFVFKRQKERWIWYILAIVFFGLMFIIAHKAPFYLPWITPLFILNFIYLWKSTDKNRLSLFFALSACYILAISISVVFFNFYRNLYKNQYIYDLDRFTSMHYTGGKIFGSGELAFYFDFNSDIIQDDVHLGYYIDEKPDFIAIDARYRDAFNDFSIRNKKLYEYIDYNLSKNYKIVFTGRRYTFYKKI